MATVTSRTAARWAATGSHSIANGTTVPFSYGGVDFYDNSVTKGLNYPDWRYRLANGMQCTTTMSGVMHTVSSKDFSASGSLSYVGLAVPPPTTYTRVTRVRYSGVSLNFSYAGSTPPLLTSADNLAKANFVKRVRDAQTSFQAVVSLGELGETLRMLVSPAKSLRNGLQSYLASLKKKKRQVRRSSPKKRKSVARRILADTWLEYSFGWKPLINDIDNAAKAIAELEKSQGEKWKPVNAIGKDLVATITPISFFGEGNVSVIGNYLSTREYDVIYRGQVSLESPSERKMEHLGFDPSNFIPSVWELIPYSFLVDYFANIDDIISAATLKRSSLRWIARTQVELIVNTMQGPRAVKPSANPNNFSTSASLSPGKCVYTKKIFSRAPYTGSLVPDLEFTIPKFGTKWINMAALAFSNRELVPFHR